MKLPNGKLFLKRDFEEEFPASSGNGGSFPVGKPQKLPICGFGVRGSFAGF
jgi:hypothetical protein